MLTEEGDWSGAPDVVALKPTPSFLIFHSLFWGFLIFLSMLWASRAAYSHFWPTYPTGSSALSGPCFFRSSHVAQIKYQVTYEVTVRAVDLGSSKPISNQQYFRCGAQVGSPPAYGGDIAGSSDNFTFLTNYVALWVANINLNLNHNYQLQNFVSQAIMGKRYSSPLYPIASLAVGTPVTVTTAAPHGMVSGQTVILAGITTPALLNGTFVITVTGPYSFSLNGSSFSGPWSGDGSVQLVQGSLEFLYADKQTIFNSNVGSVAGDALPLFVTASIRRSNSGIGRHYRSRFSLSPMSEADQLDGKWTTAKATAMSTALGNLMGPVNNGGSDSGSHFMYPQAISKRVAFMQSSPYTFNGFAQNVTGMNMAPNCGSLVRRKPKQTTAIV